jgi:hypothetical protein
MRLLMLLSEIFYHSILVDLKFKQYSLIKLYQGPLKTGRYTSGGRVIFEVNKKRLLQFLASGVKFSARTHQDMHIVGKAMKFPVKWVSRNFVTNDISMP